VIVIDASTLVEVLLASARAGAARAVLERPGCALHAPHLLDIEITQALRRYVSIGQVEAGRAQDALRDLSRLPLRRHAHGFLLPRAWELRNNLTAYDAIYVALAEALDATLLTSDARLAAAPGVRARIELV
jgi:predicted nucleic acid-binding protein